MQLKPETIKHGDRYEGVILKRLYIQIGDLFLVGLVSDPYEPAQYFYFDNEAEAELAYERMRVDGWEALDKYGYR